MRLPSREHKAVANSEIEGVPEIPFLNPARALKPLEQLRAGPALSIHVGDQASRQAPRQVLGNPSACDVGHGVNGSSLAQQLLDQCSIEVCRMQEGVDQQLVVRTEAGFCGCVTGLKNFSHQAEAIAVNAAAADPNNAIAGLNVLINDGIFVDNGNAESGKVVATRG